MDGNTLKAASSLLDESFHSQVSDLILLLRRRELKLAIAESCTGGLFSAELARHAGVSDIFAGGVVSYSNEAKATLLRVPLSLIQSHGAVSSQVVGAMAMGAINQLSADLAVSVSGVAGPSGGTPDKPVGLVWFGFCYKDMMKTVSHQFAGDRRTVQEKAVLFALEFLLRELR